MSAAGETVLTAEGITRTFGSGDAEVRAVVDAGIEVRAGELVALRGRSGSGKTALLEVLGGLARPASGSVLVNDQDLAALGEDELVALRRREIAFIFATFELIPVLSAAENVELPLRLTGTPVGERDARVRSLLDSVGLAGHAAQRPAELSGGQQQRVAVARALANRPRLLLADEPTGQLDHATGSAVMALLADSVHREGLAAIVATHDPGIAAMADRIVDIGDGRITAAPV